MEGFLIVIVFMLVGFLYSIFNGIKKNDKLYIIFIIVALASFGFFVWMNSFEDESYSENSDDDGGFTIENYNIVLDVKENNVVDVTENIAVNWYNTNHHGILKFIPYWLPYTDRNGNTVKRKSIIRDLRAVNDEYSIDTVKRKKRIRIGSADSYVSEGEKNYVIKYTYDMGKDPFEGFDEFIFHAFGDYWSTEIKNASIEVNMPKSIEGYNINFFSDKYRKNNINSVVDYTVSGNKLYANFNASKNGGVELRKALTVDIELPNNYFIGGSYNYGIISLLLIFVIILITINMVYLWFKYGRDYPKRVKTVEFYAPDNLNSAEIGYIYNKKYNKKLVISLIIQLASKGYIKIDEVKIEKSKKKQIQITKLKNRALSHKSFDSKIPNRQIEIIKLKDADDSLSQKAKYFMTNVFDNYQIKMITTSNRINLLNEVKDELVNNNYIKIVNDFDYEKISSEEEKKEMYIKQIEKYNLDIDELNKDLIELSGMEKVIFDKLFENDNQVVLSEHLTFYKVFSEIDIMLSDQFNTRINDDDATKKMYLSMKLNFAMIILYFISYYVEDLSPNLYILYWIPLVCIIISTIFIYITKRRTDYGEIIYARVLGFRDFLIKAEKDNLEALVEKDPKYFYNILPFTYVLGISKKWVKKFEDIPMPDVDMGNFNYGSEGSFYSIYDDVYVPAPVHSSSGSGCSSCGGGCSSCGGGCSSCGGGSSW